MIKGEIGLEEQVGFKEYLCCLFLGTRIVDLEES